MKRVLLFLFALVILASQGFADSVYYVTNCNSTGEGSLWKAIGDARASFGNSVYFNIKQADVGYATPEGAGLVTDEAGTNKWFRIIVDAALPTINTNNIKVLGSTQTWEANNALGPKIELRCASGVTGINGIQIAGGSNCTIEGLAINGFTGTARGGISMTTGGGRNHVKGCYLGTTASGEAARPNTWGIYLASATSNLIGGTTFAERNVISGNITGNIRIYLSSTNEVKGNYIGTNRTATAALGSTPDGIKLDSSSFDSRIGGKTDTPGTGEGNVISGHSTTGINVSGIGGNAIIGNLIGTNAGGTVAIPNGQINSSDNGGIVIYSKDNRIGDGTARGRNVISGNNSAGVQMIDAAATGNRLEGNYIGTALNGTSVSSNEYGVIIYGAANNNIVGSTETNGRNIISGNKYDGISIHGSGVTTGTLNSSNEVLGNFIGTDKNGTTALANGNDGINIDNKAVLSRVGNGTVQGRNVISGNVNYGLHIIGVGTDRNIICGNYIGSDLNGTAEVYNENEAVGVVVEQGSANQIGGTLEGQGNLISGNPAGGIKLIQSTSNEIHGNLIGIDAYGAVGLSNGGNGIWLENNSSFNQIGGVSPLGRGNTIAKNLTGILLQGSSNDNRIKGNLIGTTASGEAPLGNIQYGVWLQSNCSRNKIGGLLTGEGNVIASNAFVGINIDGGSVNTGSNEVIGNAIGTNAGGTINLGNQRYGIDINTGPMQYSHHNIIGPANTIAYNGSASYPSGVLITGFDAVKNVITQNSFYGNYSQGIDLTNNGNHEIASPEISAAGYSQVNLLTTVTGEAAPALGTVEVFRSENGQGKTYLGSTLADVAGKWSITFSGLVPGDTVVATGTTANPETSEFSRVATVFGAVTTTTTSTTTTTTSTTTTTVPARQYTESDLGVPGMSVDVPAGATASPVTVTASAGETPPSGSTPPVGFSVGGKVYELGPTGTTFLTPVTITIPLSGALKDPHVYYWDGTKWSTSGIVVTAVTATTITFTTTHFSSFAPMGAIPSNLVRFGPNPYNPANGNAHFWYWLDASADTSIYVADLGGSLVWKQSYASGTNGGLAGANNITYDGKSAWGDVLGNGAYIYKIIQGGKSIGGGKIAIIK